MTLTFDLETWKSKGVFYQSWSMYLWSFMILGLNFLELSSANHFTVSSHCDLDLWPSELIIEGVICQSWLMYLCVLELSSGNHLMDGLTDMCKTINPLFFEGGHNKLILFNLSIYPLKSSHFQNKYNTNLVINNNKIPLLSLWMLMSEDQGIKTITLGCEINANKNCVLKIFFSCWSHIYKFEWIDKSTTDQPTYRLQYTRNNPTYRIDTEYFACCLHKIRKTYLHVWRF